MRENFWKSRLVASLRARGAAVLSLHGHGMQAPGWPDIYVAHLKWRGWIELKAPGGALSEAQRVVIRKLRDRGDNVVVLQACDDWKNYGVTGLLGGQVYENHVSPDVVDIFEGMELLELLRSLSTAR